MYVYKVISKDNQSYIKDLFTVPEVIYFYNKNDERVGSWSFRKKELNSFCGVMDLIDPEGGFFRRAYWKLLIESPGLCLLAPPKFIKEEYKIAYAVTNTITLKRSINRNLLKLKLRKFLT